MLYSLKKFTTEMPITAVFFEAFLTLFGVVVLISCGVIAWESYLELYTMMDGGFLASCVAITGAVVITMCAGFLAFAPVVSIALAIVLLLDYLDVI